MAYIAAFVAGAEITTHPGLPEFVKTLQLFWCFDESEQVPDEITEFTELFGRANVGINIDPQQNGKFCHVIAYYVLPNGVKSHVSDTLTFAASTA